MRLFVTGATGLVGRRVVVDRLERGDQVVIVSRDAARAAQLFAAGANPNVTVVAGNPAIPGAWQRAVDGCDVIVHLAGAGVAERRWTRRYKQLIATSRIDSTHQVVEAIRAATVPPAALINASAIGWYGDTGDREVDETAPACTGDFFGDLAERWEEEASKAEPLGPRAVLIRIGLVLDARGGALKPMLPPFRLFLGGPIGSGRQYMSWIHWRDLVGIIDLAIRSPELRGPVNATAPNPVTSRAFARGLGRVLGRPSWLPVPAIALRAMVGEMARYAAMSQRVVPTRALSLGYRFVYPEIEPALAAVLDKGDGGVSDGGEETVAVADRPAAGVEAAGALPARPIRLVAVGVDGTLLRSDGRLSQGVIRVSRSVATAGCVIVLATARPPRSVRGLLETLQITAPAITYNGAVIWNPLEARAQFHQPLDEALAREVIAAVRAGAPELCIGLERLDRWFTDRIAPELEQSGVPITPDEIGPLEAFLDAPVTQVNVFGRPDQIEQARRVIDEAFWRERRIALFQPEPTLIQIAHPLADKGIALQRIAHRMGADRDAVMAIGDGRNDLGMIEWAGFGVAVGNAIPEAKALAQAVVPTNDEQGVARGLQWYVQGQRTEGADAALDAEGDRSAR